MNLHREMKRTPRVEEQKSTARDKRNSIVHFRSIFARSTKLLKIQRLGEFLETPWVRSIDETQYLTT